MIENTYRDEILEIYKKSFDRTNEFIKHWEKDNINRVWFDKNGKMHEYTCKECVKKHGCDFKEFIRTHDEKNCLKIEVKHE